FGCDLEQFIADIVSQAVIDELEIVQIDKKDRHLLAGALRQEQGLVDTVDEQISVGETGQAVVVGLIFKLLLICFPFSNIFKGFDNGQQFPPAVTYRRSSQDEIAGRTIQAW